MWGKDSKSASERTGAMQLDGWKGKFLGNLSVLDGTGSLQSEALNPLSHVRAARNSGTTPERLELDVRDDAVVVDTDL